MKVTTVLFAAIMAGVSLPAMGQSNNQTDNSNPAALAACVQAANQKYRDTWANLCFKSGKVGYCAEFIGSPRDREFSQLRIEELTVCSKLYGK